MTNVAIVTGGDKNYFPMIAELIKSVRALDDKEVANWDFCVIDAGLTEEQHNYLKDECAEVVRPEWPTKDGSEPARVNGRNYIKADVCRPFIPEYFSDQYDVFFWIDSDCWVQNAEGLRLFVQGALQDKLTVLAAADRCWPRGDRIQWFGPLPVKAKTFYYSNALKAFDRKMARQLFPHHTLSAGVFALKRTAPHWKVWQDWTLKGLVKGNPFTSGQLGLGIMHYIEGLPAAFVPAWAHWLCQHTPAWDEQKKQFVETHLPHHPLSILHLTGWDAMRKDRSLTLDVTTTEDKVIQKSLRYDGFDGESLGL